MIAERKPKVDTSQRHPDFDECWEKYQGLVWYLSKRIGERRTPRLHPCDLVGTLVLRFNHMLHHYDESRGSFTNLFGSGLGHYLRRTFLAKDSDAEHVAYNKIVADTPIQKTKMSKRWQLDDPLADIYSCYLRRRQKEEPQHDDSEVGEYLSSFASKNDFWSKILEILTPREAEVICRRYIIGDTFQAIADERGISRQAVQQVEARALKRIRYNLRKEKALRPLYKEHR